MLTKLRNGTIVISRCNQSMKYREFQTVSDVRDIFSVQITQVKSTLIERNVNFNEGYACLISQDCPLQCVDRKPNKKFFINKITGSFVCHACGRIGPWTWLSRRLEETGSQPIAACVPSSSSVTPRNFEPVAIASVAHVRKCLTDLNLQHLTTPMLAQLGACVNTKVSQILLPLRGGPDDNVGAWVALGVGTSDTPTEELIGLNPKDLNSSPLLLANSAAWNSEEAVLVPSASDFLALTSKSIPSICCAAGFRHLPQEVLPLLEQLTRITFWFGKHTDYVKSFAHKLGVSRCYLVSSRVGSAHETVIEKEGRQQLLSVVKSAEPMKHPYVLSFRDIKEDVRSEIENKEILGTPWMRFPKLTSIIGGFRRGELTVLTGPSGSGKTTFLSEYSLDLAEQGVSTLWGSFEIRNVRLARTMLTQLAGVCLEENLDKFEETADLMETLPLHFMAFHGQQPLKTVMQVVEHATYVFDLGHIIIDNVQFMMGLSSNDNSLIGRFNVQDRIVEAFRNHATCTNCHVTLVVHPRKEVAENLLTINSVYGSAKATQEADNVLIIQDQMSLPGGRRFLQVVKNRYNGVLGNMLLNFDRPSMSFSKKGKKSIAFENVPTSNANLQYIVPVQNKYPHKNAENVWVLPLSSGLVFNESSRTSSRHPETMMMSNCNLSILQDDINTVSGCLEDVLDDSLKTRSDDRGRTHT